ncbi:hypothetical protein JCM14036_33940 [Desulfotomaculum defluvii]
MKQKKPQQYFTALIIGIVGALMVFFIYQQLASLKMARQEAVELETTLRQTNTQIQSLKKLKQQAVDLQAQIVELEQVMPTAPLEDMLIKDLQAKASSHDLQLLQVSFDQYTNKKDFIEMPFALSLEGQYLDLIGFLKDLQRGPRAVLVKDINITKVDPDLPLINIDITACTFYTNS